MSASPFSTPSPALQREVTRRRSFAIISHPDAGKTTLTEKFLLYGGALQLAGSVTARKNQRATTSDWMELEKQRGISVSSTVLQFEYKDCVVNILDTDQKDMLTHYGRGFDVGADAFDGVPVERTAAGVVLWPPTTWSPSTRSLRQAGPPLGATSASSLCARSCASRPSRAAALRGLRAPPRAGRARAPPGTRSR